MLKKFLKVRWESKKQSRHSLSEKSILNVMENISSTYSWSQRRIC